MDDDRLKSSPRELAALRALIEDPVIRVELNTFRARYWPIIKNFGIDLVNDLPLCQLWN